MQFSLQQTCCGRENTRLLLPDVALIHRFIDAKTVICHMFSQLYTNCHCTNYWGLSKHKTFLNTMLMYKLLKFSWKEGGWECNLFLLSICTDRAYICIYTQACALHCFWVIFKAICHNELPFFWHWVSETSSIKVAHWWHSILLPSNLPDNLFCCQKKKNYTVLKKQDISL